MLLAPACASFDQFRTTKNVEGVQTFSGRIVLTRWRNVSKQIGYSSYRDQLGVFRPGDGLQRVLHPGRTQNFHVSGTYFSSGNSAGLCSRCVLLYCMKRDYRQWNNPGRRLPAWAWCCFAASRLHHRFLKPPVVEGRSILAAAIWNWRNRRSHYFWPFSLPACRRGEQPAYARALWPSRNFFCCAGGGNRRPWNCCGFGDHDDSGHICGRRRVPLPGRLRILACCLASALSR